MACIYASLALNELTECKLTLDYWHSIILNEIISVLIQLLLRFISDVPVVSIQ